MTMRPSIALLVSLLVFCLMFGALAQTISTKRHDQKENFQMLREVVSHFGLSDLAISTEARYTRHPATSDQVVVSMDHPGAIDHFPSTLFWAPVK